MAKCGAGKKDSGPSRRDFMRRAGLTTAFAATFAGVADIAGITSVAAGTGSSKAARRGWATISRSSITFSNGTTRKIVVHNGKSQATGTQQAPNCCDWQGCYSPGHCGAGGCADGYCCYNMSGCGLGGYWCLNRCNDCFIECIN